jgi:hypothetical protein
LAGKAVGAPFVGAVGYLLGFEIAARRDAAPANRPRSSKLCATNPCSANAAL